ncbi:MAG: M23 family metallopeptidase [Rhodothermales bacterium]
MRFSRWLWPAVLLLLLAATPSQPDYPQGYFRSPLGIPLYMAGNFAEMRSNHFHGGLDLKTNGREGYRIYAAAEGYVSRIAVSPSGFGNAIYLAHPNGYTTVYAHLNRFADPIQDYVRSVQYQRETFRVNLYLEPGQFPVAKGDVIAISGNSGSSSGPHLHFEVRDTPTQEPINPELFGFDIKDTTPPRLYAMRVYVADANSFARIVWSDGRSPTLVSRHDPATIDLDGSNGQFSLNGVRRIEGAGRLGFALRTHDYHDGSSNHLGPMIIRLDRDGERLFESTKERFNFDETRQLNAHVDYAARHHTRRWFERSHLLPGNQLRMYETREGGFLNLEAGFSHAMRYHVEDVRGNTATLRFTVDGSADQPALPSAPEHEQILPYNRPSAFRTESVVLALPDGALYEDLWFDYERETASAPNLHSDIHHIHRPDTPLQKAMSLSIAASSLPASLRDKAFIASINDRGEPRGSIGGSYSDGFVHARTRSFGTYAVATDTTPPTVELLNRPANADFRGRESVSFTIKDNLAGIDSYTGRVDGQWVLFAYDAKRSRITYTFDDRAPSGSRTLELTVVDNVGNTSTETLRFTR